MITVGCQNLTKRLDDFAIDVTVKLSDSDKQLEAQAMYDFLRGDSFRILLLKKLDDRFREHGVFIQRANR
jgi:hypothetical protein